MKKDLTYRSVLIFLLVFVLTIPLHEFGNALILILEGKTFYVGFDPVTFTFYVAGTSASYLCSFFGGFFAGLTLLLLVRREPILISLSLSQFVYSVIELYARHVSFLTLLSVHDIMISNFLLINFILLSVSLIALFPSIQIFYHPPKRVRILVARIHGFLYDARIKAEVRKKLDSGEYRTSPNDEEDEKQAVPILKPHSNSCANCYYCTDSKSVGGSVYVLCTNEARSTNTKSGWKWIKSKVGLPCWSQENTSPY